jgi:transcription termination factor Rho
MTDSEMDSTEPVVPARKRAAAKKVSARKTVAKKVLPPAEVVPEVEMAPVIAVPAPVRKVARKTAAKKTVPEVKESAVAGAAPVPGLEVAGDVPVPVKKKAVRRVTAKKAVVPAEHEPVGPASSEPQRVPVAPEPDPGSGASTEPAEAVSGTGENSARQPQRGRRDARFVPAGRGRPERSGNPAARPPSGSAERDRDGEGRSDRRVEGRGYEGRRPPMPRTPEGDEATGETDGLSPAGGGADASRRLTKWERWKQRKEKFRLLKQQRYLDRQAQMPQGGHPQDGPAGPAGPDRGPRPEAVLGPPEDCSGILEISPGKEFGFLRPRDRGFQPMPSDPFVSPELVREHGLREGVWIDGIMRRGGRGPQIVEIRTVNGRAPDVYRTLPLFEELTAINPNKRYLLETVPGRHTTRLIDFIAPVGRGQRGLIVAPPRAGKTTILQHIAEAVQENYEDTRLMVLLVDERPEEVTEIARALPRAEVMASNNDRDPREHIRIAHLAIERAKRLVEAGEHVFMLLDSITRLARAFNNAMRGHGGGKGSLSGGVDARALEGARRLFASARNTREAGSLTIVATALVETNSRADELIFQEFKGTGNMELVLDRRIAQQYIYPAVDIFKSGTRREELLLPPHQMEKIHLIRRGLAGHKPVEAAERLIHFMNKFPSNAQMLIEIKSRE